MASSDNRKAFEDFQTYCRSLPDFKDIGPYLEADTSPFEPRLEAQAFVPDFSRAIVVDNIPSVDTEKVDRLKTVLLQIYNQFGETLTAEDIDMPMDPKTKKTCGFCFIKYKASETAEKAVLTTQDFALDKRHVFKVNLYSDMYKYVDVPETYQELEVPPFTPRPDTLNWLNDEHCRDMFVIRHEHETEVMWSNANNDPEVVYGGEREKSSGRSWCESYVTWSPQGTYLATFHPQGVRLWGGADFQPHSRFAHPNAEMIDFSPCENYLITYRLDTNSPGDPNEAIVIWDVRSGEKKKVFKLRSPLDFKFQVQTTVSERKAPSKSSLAAMAGAAGVPAPKSVDKLIRGIVTAYDADRRTITVQEGNTNYDNIPVDKVQPLMDPNRLKWSPDGQYAAKVGVDIIQVFAVPSMALLDKKSIAAKDMLEFVWSPKTNMISYWAPGSGNHPAQIHIIEIPSRRDVCSRKVFDIQDGRMIWQSEGEYLCVNMTKQAGKKKSYILMLFRTAEENVPVEQLELNEPIIHFSWEQGGSKFAVIHGESRSPTVSFYTMKGSNMKGGVQAVTFMYSITGKQYGEVIWSPAGGVAALAQFASDACMFDLHDVESNVALASRRHDRGNRLTWDPSGRYISSCTIIPLRGSGLAARAIADDGFNIYTFQGSLISQTKKERLYQFSWRPRPKDLLTAEEKAKVNKNLRKYEKIFDKEDRKKKSEIDKAIMDVRLQQATVFYQRLASKKADIARAKARRIQLRDGYDSDDDSNYKVVIQLQETIVSTKEEVL